MREFPAAPWAPKLKFGSIVAVAVCAVIAATSGAAFPRGAVPIGAVANFLLVIPPLLVAGALLFVVRGYEIEARSLGVRRLLWVTRIPLDGLQRAWHDAEAMQRSIRIFGNGGLFAISGLFRNRSLGSYRAFVTRPDRAVVLRTATRVVVISPAEPRAFLDALAARYPHAVIAKP